jgi:hypothetical protein
LYQAVAVTQQGADNTNSILRAEGGTQQPRRNGLTSTIQ